MPSAFQTSSSSSSNGRGPHAQVWRSRQSGADRVERTEFELSVTSRELNVAHEVLVLGVQCCEFVGEHHVGFRRSRVDVHDVGQLTAPVHRPQHAHDRSDATAGGDEQDLLRRRIRQREVARRRGQSNDGSRRHGPADEVAREKALGPWP